MIGTEEYGTTISMLLDI